MSIKEDTTVIAGKKVSVIDVDSVTTIKHAKTGKVYATEEEANKDIQEDDIQKDVAIKVNKIPDIFGGTS